MDRNSVADQKKKWVTGRMGASLADINQEDILYNMERELGKMAE